jgi:hypothetical protein
MLTYNQRLMTESLSSLPATTPISLSSSSQDWYPEDAHRTLRISVWHLGFGKSISIRGVEYGRDGRVEI